MRPHPHRGRASSIDPAGGDGLNPLVAMPWTSCRHSGASRSLGKRARAARRLAPSPRQRCQKGRAAGARPRCRETRSLRRRCREDECSYLGRALPLARRDCGALAHCRGRDAAQIRERRRIDGGDFLPRLGGGFQKLRDELGISSWRARSGGSEILTWASRKYRSSRNRPCSISSPDRAVWRR